MDNKKIASIESLALPREYWDMKLEPASPPSALASELLVLEDPSTSFLYDDNFANGIMLIDDNVVGSLQEDINMELLSDEDLVVEFLDLKEEECLLDQKALHYIDYETTGFPQHLDVVSQDIQAITKVQVAADSADYQHADSSLILQQLTPPQSPPQFDAYQQQPQQALVKEEHKVLSFATDATVTEPSAAAAAATFSFNNLVAGSEIARETQLVDDIVNMRAQELQLPIDWQLYNDDSESQSSSSLGSSSSSRSSSNGDVSGVGSSIADADEEWQPKGSSSSSSSPAHTIGEELQSTTATDSSSGGKKRTRTYGRGVEDRKIRKKEQNKNAATRYRQKKKMEIAHVLGEEQQLVQANEALQRKLNECRRESRYLCQLIREFHKDRKQQ